MSNLLDVLIYLAIGYILDSLTKKPWENTSVGIVLFWPVPVIACAAVFVGSLIFGIGSAIAKKMWRSEEKDFEDDTY